MEWARRLLALEAGTGGSALDWAVAAGQVHDKLLERFDPLLGAAGVRALLVRSQTLSKSRFACFGDVHLLDSTASLRDCLHAQGQEVALECAAVLFGTFLELLQTFIGQRLTTQILRSTWPTLDAVAPKETES